MGWSAGGGVGGVGGVPILPPVGPSCAWRGAAVSGSVCQFRVCSCLLGQCTRSVGNAPLLFGCSAPYRVQRPLSGAAPLIGCSAPYRVQRPCACGGCRGCGGLLCLGCLPGLGCLLLGSLWRLMLWFLRNVARNSPTCISNIEIAPLEFCGFLDTYEKLGYPNYVRVLIDEAPQANSCVRTSAHDTAHDPRDTSNTTPTPHNAKSRMTPQATKKVAPARMSGGHPFSHSTDA